MIYLSRTDARIPSSLSCPKHLPDASERETCRIGSPLAEHSFLSISQRLSTCPLPQALFSCSSFGPMSRKTYQDSPLSGLLHQTRSAFLSQGRLSQSDKCAPSAKISRLSRLPWALPLDCAATVPACTLCPRP